MKSATFTETNPGKKLDAYIIEIWSGASPGKQTIFVASQIFGLNYFVSVTPIQNLIFFATPLSWGAHDWIMINHFNTNESEVKMWANTQIHTCPSTVQIKSLHNLRWSLWGGGEQVSEEDTKGYIVSSLFR